MLHEKIKEVTIVFNSRGEVLFENNFNFMHKLYSRAANGAKAESMREGKMKMQDLDTKKICLSCEKFCSDISIKYI